MSHDTKSKDYQTVCKILDKLTDLEEHDILADIVACLCYNYDNAADYVIGHYQDILQEEEDL